MLSLSSRCSILSVTGAGTANMAIQLVQLDESAGREEAGKMLGVAQTIEVILEHHLSDEEELAVPIILHHRLRG